MSKCSFFREIQACMESEGVDFDPVNMKLRFRLSENPRLDRMLVGLTGRPVLNRMRNKVRNYMPVVRSRIKSILRRNESFVRNALKISGKKVFVDATRNVGRIELLNSHPNIYVKIIHLVRDPRGYTYSALRHDNTSAMTAERAARN